MHIPAPPRSAFHQQYFALLAAGWAANPPSVARGRPGPRGHHAQSPARNLLDQLVLGKAQVLAFLDDLTIPVDNNQAESDLRRFKVQQKISGSFRSYPGALRSHQRLPGDLA